MKKLGLIAVLGLTISAFGGQTPAAPQAQQPNTTNVPSQAGALRVNSPRANEKLSQTFVHVEYQLVNRGVAAAPSPNFTVQLDGTDPVTTTAYDYTFTGLTPGPHTVTVTLVDANGAPIAESSVAVKFTVVNPTRGTTPGASLFQSSNLQMARSDIGTPLPMMSMVGFMMLVGGICTAIRNR